MYQYVCMCALGSMCDRKSVYELLTRECVPIHWAVAYMAGMLLPLALFVETSEAE